MGRTLPLLTIISLLLGVLGVLVFTADGPGLLIFVAFSIAVGVLMVMQKSQIMYAGGGVALLGAIMGILGMLESVGTESGTLDLGITAAVGKAAAILSYVVASAALLAQRWGDDGQDWMQYAGVLGIAGSVVLVLFTAPDLGDIGFNLNYVTALLLVLASLPAFQAFREAE